MRKILWSLSILLAAATAAQADDIPRTVPSGTNQRIDFLASVNPDCSSIGLPTVRLVTGPDHGVVTTDRARDFLPFPKTNPRSRCNSRRVAGLKLFYRSKNAFFGVDRVRLLVISAEGVEREATYVIQVK